MADVRNSRDFANISLEIINNLHFTFIVDNTPFPYPEGAYPYTDIHITLCN